MPPFQTLGAALGEAHELQTRGWQVVQVDQPEIAEVSFFATKKFSAELHFRRLVWRPYGYLLTPEVQLVEDEDSFFDLFGAHLPHRMVKCDDPTDDLLGFVCHCKWHDRRSLVFRFSLDLARDLGPVFLDARNAAQLENLRFLLSDA